MNGNKGEALPKALAHIKKKMEAAGFEESSEYGWVEKGTGGSYAESKPAFFNPEYGKPKRVLPSVNRQEMKMRTDVNGVTAPAHKKSARYDYDAGRLTITDNETGEVKNVYIGEDER